MKYVTGGGGGMSQMTWTEVRTRMRTGDQGGCGTKGYDRC